MSDERLRQYFQRVRGTDTRRTPSFEATLQRCRPGRRGLAPALAAVSVLAAITLWLQPTPQPQVQISEWRSPTEWLLESPFELSSAGLPTVSEEAFRCDGCF